jgi:hypothetical protein
MLGLTTNFAGDLRMMDDISDFLASALDRPAAYRR